MATVDKNLNSGIKPIELSSAIVTAQKKAMPVMTSGITFNGPGLAGESEYRKKQQEKAKENSKALGQGGTNNFGNYLTPIAKGINTVSSGFTAMNQTGSKQALGVRDSLSSAAINSGIPVAMAFGAATKFIDAIGDATGMHLDEISKTASERAGAKGASGLNNFMQAIPGVGTLSSIFAGKTNDSNNFNQEGASVLAGYSGSQNDVNAAGQLANKKSLFGVNKMNDFINQSNDQVSMINEIGRTNTLRKQSDYARDLAQQNLNRYAGTNYMTHAVGKNGMKIMSRKELQAILAKQKLQNGGVIGTDTNILPEGSLHARLNHLQNTNPELEDTTRKGIPVLDEQGNQVAEIERDEIVLRLEVTQKIEELMKDGSDEAMIEAGKLLVSEIIDNTQDNTGQIIEEVENGN